MRRQFSTLIEFPDEPSWRPLVAVAQVSRASEALPSIDEDDFMYMAAVVRRTRRLRTHLYKHREIRHYLNLDEAGHAYQYCDPGDEDEDADDESGGRYRLHRSIAAALIDVLT